MPKRCHAFDVGRQPFGSPFVTQHSIGVEVRIASKSGPILGTWYLIEDKDITVGHSQPPFVAVVENGYGSDGKKAWQVVLFPDGDYSIPQLRCDVKSHGALSIVECADGVISLRVGQTVIADIPTTKCPRCGQVAAQRHGDDGVCLPCFDEGAECDADGCAYCPSANSGDNETERLTAGSHISWEELWLLEAVENRIALVYFRMCEAEYAALVESGADAEALIGIESRRAAARLHFSMKLMQMERGLENDSQETVGYPVSPYIREGMWDALKQVHFSPNAWLSMDGPDGPFLPTRLERWTAVETYLAFIDLNHLMSDELTRIEFDRRAEARRRCRQAAQGESVQMKPEGNSES